MADIVFNFTEEITPPTPDGQVLLNFLVPAPIMHLGMAWGVTAGTIETHEIDAEWETQSRLSDALIINAQWQTQCNGFDYFVSDVRYAVATYLNDTYQLNARWETLARLVEILPLDLRWAATDAPFERLDLNARWETIVNDIALLDIDLQFAVSRIIADAMAVDLRWITDYAPSEFFESGLRWAVQAPASDSDDLGLGWSALAPSEETMHADYLWQTFLWGANVLDVDLLWYWNAMVARAWSIQYPAQVRRAWSIQYELGRSFVRRAWSIDCALLSRVRRAWGIKYAIKTSDTVRRAWSIRYPILDGSVIIAVAPPTVTVRGQTIVLDTAEVNLDEGEFAWTCQLTLQDPAHYSLFGPDEPFTVTLGTEQYAFIRQEPRFDRPGQVDLNATIAGIGPVAVHAEPRAPKITRTWDAATLASGVLDELFGAATVELRILDWSIPGGRLAVDGQTPMDVAQSLARATGGFIESEPDGALYIRYAWPVSVPFLEGAAPDQIYDDTRDVFNAAESVTASRIANKVRILDVTADAGAIFTVEIDSREDGFNSGRTSFIPGDQPALLIFKSERVQLDSVLPSAGNIAELSVGMMTVTETLTFAESREAMLRYPTAAIDSYKWLGNDLGVPVIAEENKVRVPAAGVGMLKVTYQTAFLARRLSGVPAVLNGETEYDVLVLAEGSQQ